METQAIDRIGSRGRAGKPDDQRRVMAVRKLIAGAGVYICDECVDLCRDIIAEEVGVIEALPQSSQGIVSEGLRALSQQAEQLARDLQGLARLVDAGSDEATDREPPAT